MLGDRPNQLDRQRPDVRRHAAGPARRRRAPAVPITEAGLRPNVDVGLRYLEAWLAGTGAAAIHNLMEDAATAEISRAQLWQWVTHGVAARRRLPIDRATVAPAHRRSADRDRGRDGDRRRRWPASPRPASVRAGRPRRRFAEFLTLPAYELLD